MVTRSTSTEVSVVVLYLTFMPRHVPVTMTLPSCGQASADHVPDIVFHFPLTVPSMVTTRTLLRTMWTVDPNTVPLIVPWRTQVLPVTSAVPVSTLPLCSRSTVPLPTASPLSFHQLP